MLAVFFRTYRAWHAVRTLLCAVQPPSHLRRISEVPHAPCKFLRPEALATRRGAVVRDAPSSILRRCPEAAQQWRRHGTPLTSHKQSFRVFLLYCSLFHRACHAIRTPLRAVRYIPSRGSSHAPPGPKAVHQWWEGAPRFSPPTDGCFMCFLCCQPASPWTAPWEAWESWETFPRVPKVRDRFPRVRDHFPKVRDPFLKVQFSQEGALRFPPLTNSQESTHTHEQRW